MKGERKGFLTPRHAINSRSTAGFRSKTLGFRLSHVFSISITLSQNTEHNKQCDHSLTTIPLN
jgi:hypothetical protein